MDIKMRKMLISISNLIGPEDLKRMKFYCTDCIPLRARDEIETALDLFEKLEQRGKLKPDDLSFLETLLGNTCAGRTDLVDVLYNYQGITRPKIEHKVNDEMKCEDQQLPPMNPGMNTDLRAVFHFLTQNLGREYMMVLRRLGIPDPILDQILEENPRNIQMTIQNALKYWYQSNGDEASIDMVVQALRAERRNDLAQRIKRGDI